MSHPLPVNTKENMNLDNDYDNDGNNIVPCPICLSAHCPSKEGGKCPDEAEYVKAMSHPIPQEVEDIVKELFEAGKRYGEDIGYAKDEILYEMRDSAIRTATQALLSIYNSGGEAERERVREIVNAKAVVSYSRNENIRHDAFKEVLDEALSAPSSEDND